MLPCLFLKRNLYIKYWSSPPIVVVLRRCGGVLAAPVVDFDEAVAIVSADDGPGAALRSSGRLAV